MQNRKKLPVGIDSFEKMIRQNFYYVDKTQLITELLCNWGEVNLLILRMNNRYVLSGKTSASLPAHIKSVLSGSDLL